jgi:hypothetical protein
MMGEIEFPVILSALVGQNREPWIYSKVDIISARYKQKLYLAKCNQKNISSS